MLTPLALLPSRAAHRALWVEGLPVCAGMVCFGLVDFCNCPAPLAVLLGGVCGVIGWAAHAH